MVSLECRTLRRLTSTIWQLTDTLRTSGHYRHVFSFSRSSFRLILSSLRKKISVIVGNEISSANEQQGLGYAVLILVIIISPCIIFLVRNATLTIQIFSLSLAKKAQELKVEKKKADKLLFQMLPPTVAISLQQRKHVTAETFESVTVYFSDIADFLTLGSYSLHVNVCCRRHILTAKTILRVRE